MGEVAVIERPQLTAGHRPMAIVPTSMDEAYRLANAICMAGMAPKGLDTPEKAMVAIMQGMEVGLTPMASMQRIAVVNGRPTIWGDAAIGLVRASGLCEWIKESIVGEGDARMAVCEAKRKGDPESVRSTFSIADAKTAKLWNKRGHNGQDTPWITHPDRMLKMRARAFALRDLFADVLGGMYIREEIDDDAPRDAAPKRVAPPPPPPESAASPSPAAEPEAPAAHDAHAAGADTGRRAPPPPVEDEKPEPVQASRPVSYAENSVAFLERFAKRCEEAEGEDELNDNWFGMIEPIEDEMFPPDREQAVQIYKRNKWRLEP